MKEAVRGRIHVAKVGDHRNDVAALNYFEGTHVKYRHVSVRAISARRSVNRYRGNCNIAANPLHLGAWSAARRPKTVD